MSEGRKDDPREGQVPAGGGSEVIIGSNLAAASFAADRHLPSILVASSEDLHWESVLAREYLDPEETEGFTTLPSPDLLIVVNLSGSFEIESRRGDGWARATYGPGSIGVTAPGRSATLRWRQGDCGRRRSLHLHLSAQLLRSTADSLGEGDLVSELPDALVLDDPVMLAIAEALGQALRRRSEPLHADGLAQALALHVLWGRHQRERRGPEEIDAPSGLAGRVVPRVREYLRDNVAEEVRLDDLAREVAVSKFHLLRVFAKETGETPHTYLMRLRMRRAGNLLRTTELPVHQVANECGYRSAGQFARAFRRQFGESPSDYRRRIR